MAFTGRLGSSDSRLGNLVLGLGAARGRRFRRSSRQPAYRVQVIEFDTADGYGYGDLIAEFDRPHAVGWADYLNNVPEAFFSLHQDDPKIRLLRGLGGKAHVRIWRNDDLVWVGWVSLERDTNGDDAIFYCYGYLAGYFWSLTDWDQTWTSETVGTIVEDVVERARDFTRSRMGFIAIRGIEEPPTAAGGSTPITLPEYRAFYKRILYVLQEMAAISGSDTGNSTAFRITHSTSPTFYFQAQAGTTRTNMLWRYGDGRVADFHEYGMPIYHRNDVLSVGQQPRDLILRKQVEDTADMDDGWGRMQEPLFLAWVRDESELERVTKQRAAWAKREDVNLQLIFYPGSEAPPGASDARFALGDTIPVKIDRGVTNIDKNQQVTGVFVTSINGQEQMSAMMQDPVSG